MMKTYLVIEQFRPGKVGDFYERYDRMGPLLIHISLGYNETHGREAPPAVKVDI
jgi:hypothetical protein